MFLVCYCSRAMSNVCTYRIHDYDCDYCRHEDRVHKDQETLMDFLNAFVFVMVGSVIITICFFMLLDLV